MKVPSASARSPSQFWVTASSQSRSGSSGGEVVRRSAASTTRRACPTAADMRLQAQSGPHQPGMQAIRAVVRLGRRLSVAERPVQPVHGRADVAVIQRSSGDGEPHVRVRLDGRRGACAAKSEMVDPSPASACRALARRAASAASSGSFTATSRANACALSPRATSRRTARTTVARRPGHVDAAGHEHAAGSPRSAAGGCGTSPATGSSSGSASARRAGRRGAGSPAVRSSPGSARTSSARASWDRWAAVAVLTTSSAARHSSRWRSRGWRAANTSVATRSATEAVPVGVAASGGDGVG